MQTTRAAQNLRWSGTTGSYCTLETTEVIEQPFLFQMCGNSLISPIMALIRMPIPQGPTTEQINTYIVRPVADVD